jgi:hypothetical protein
MGQTGGHKIVLYTDRIYPTPLAISIKCTIEHYLIILAHRRHLKTYYKAYVSVINDQAFGLIILWHFTRWKQHRHFKIPAGNS